MRRFRPQRRLIAALGITMLAATTSFMFAGYASAAPTNAATFGVGIGARLDVAYPRLAPILHEGADLEPIGEVHGAVDSKGTLEISTLTGISLASSIDPIDRARDTMLHAPLDQVRIDMPHGFTGAIDAAKGTVDLVATGATYNFLGLEGPETFASATDPVDLHLRATDYNPKTGVATLVGDPALALPPLAAPTPSCDLTGDLAGIASLPTGDIGVGLFAGFAITPRITPQTPLPPATTRPTTPPTTRAAAPHTSVTPPSATPAPSATALIGAAIRASNATTKAKATPSTAAKRAAAKPGSTSTTAYVWRGGAGPDLFDEGDRVAAPRASVGPLVAPQPAASRTDSEGNRFGIGVIALVAGGTLGGLFLLRTEARRLFRRRPRALF